MRISECGRKNCLNSDFGMRKEELFEFGFRNAEGGMQSA